MALVGRHPRRSTTCWTTGSPTTAKDGRPGGLGPRTIRQVHLCLRQALGYAMKWHDLPANPAADAEPPAAVAHTPASLTPELIGMLLAAACHDRRPWLRAFTVLAAATGARNGELCGLEWHDLDLEAGTLRFRQALSSVDQQLGGPGVAHRAPHPSAAGTCRTGVPGLRTRRRVDAHPHLLRHSLASAMAAAKEPASVIAGQLRHADGGTLASEPTSISFPRRHPAWPG